MRSVSKANGLAFALHSLLAALQNVSLTEPGCELLSSDKFDIFFLVRIASGHLYVAKERTPYGARAIKGSAA